MSNDRKVYFQGSYDQIPQGISFPNKDIVFFKGDGGDISAIRNRCKHQGGRFRKAGEDQLVCGNHGWCLDLHKMVYINPSGEMPHPKLDVARVGDQVIVSELVSRRPWLEQARSPQQLFADEFQIGFYAHACVAVQCGPLRLFTDPWLAGPAFTRGWWLLHEPPETWLEDLAQADGIYISHNHSDHMNVHSLRLLYEANPQVPIYVPDFPSGSCLFLLKKMGFTHINAVPFDTWVHLDEHTRFMVLCDASGRDDSGLLLDYKGHLLLNIVDAVNLNDGILPEKIDVLLSSFAGGATGHPVIWEDLYGREQIGELARKKIAHVAQRGPETAALTRPDLFVPFAGYFTEAHPADADIHAMNCKNTPQSVCEKVSRRVANVKHWIPKPGEWFDIGLQSLKNPKTEPGYVKSYDFKPYLEEIAAALHDENLATLSGLESYFEWAGFRGPLLLHVIETDESFQRILRAFYVDFTDGSIYEEKPSVTLPYLRMKVRADVFRYVLREGLPWEEITIGFQARLYRDPDIYQFEFWDHFQNRLPQEPPVWSPV